MSCNLPHVRLYVLAGLAAGFMASGVALCFGGVCPLVGGMCFLPAACIAFGLTMDL